MSLAWIHVQYCAKFFKVKYPIHLSNKYLRDNKSSALLCTICLLQCAMKSGLHTNYSGYGLLILFPCCIYFNFKAQTKVSISERPLLAIQFLYARLKNGTYYAVAMSVRLSVRPSVRPRFTDFSSTCFEISIWNFVYTFSRWHDMSSLSCITIGSLWPSLQPKVGQTYFLQSWPHK